MSISSGRNSTQFAQAGKGGDFEIVGFSSFDCATFDAFALRCTPPDGALNVRLLDYFNAVLVVDDRPAGLPFHEPVGEIVESN